MVSGRLTASHHRAPPLLCRYGRCQRAGARGAGALGTARRRPRLLPAWTPQVECSCRLLRLAVLAVLWNCVDYRYGLGLFLLDVA
jgi:hypothetical protein